MRTIREIALSLALTFVSSANADPVSTDRFAIEVVRLEGAVFSGLAETPRGLVISNLADGHLYRYADGKFERFGPRLPHGIDVIGDPTGPYRIAASEAGFVVSQGWTPTGSTESKLDHAIVEVREGFQPRVISNDFWNPFDFLVEGDTLIVVDAARNSVERIEADGKRRTIFTFTRLKQEGVAMQELSPTEFSDADVYEVDAVPTAIAREGGTLFVTLFGGFPYLDDSGKVVSIGEGGGGQSRVELEGLDAPIDLVVHDSQVHVLEHGRYEQERGFIPGSGQLLVVDPTSKTRVAILTGLTRPASFVIRRDGSIVVAALDGTLTFLTPRTNGQ